MSDQSRSIRIVVFLVRQVVKNSFEDFSLGRSKGRNGRSLVSQGGKIRSIHEPNDAGVNGLENAIAGAEYEVGDG